MRLSQTTSFFVCIAILLISATAAFGDDKTKKNSATGKKSDDKKIDVEKIKEIIHRQKGDVLKVYVDDRGMFVNGKSVSSLELVHLVKKTKLSKTNIAAHANLKMKKVIEVIDLLEGQGIKEFSLTSRSEKKNETGSSDKASSKQKGTAQKKNTVQKKGNGQKVDREKIAIIIHRQKGDTVKVYMNSNGSYVNGKSVNAIELTSVIKKSGLKSAAISAEPYVAKEKIQNMELLINKAGISQVAKVKVKKPKPKK